MAYGALKGAVMFNIDSVNCICTFEEQQHLLLPKEAAGRSRNDKTKCYLFFLFVEEIQLSDFVSVLLKITSHDTL